MLHSAQEPLDFDDLSAIYRVEKKAQTLSAVRRDLYPAMASLLISLKTEYEKQMSIDSESLVSEGANQRKKKARQLSKEIVELRMQKISSLALRGAMGAQNIVDGLTSEEKEYYTEILNISKKQECILDRLSGKKTFESRAIDDRPVEKPVKKEEPVAKPIQKPIAEPISETEIPNEPEMEMLEPDFEQEFSENSEEEEFLNNEPIRSTAKTEEIIIGVNEPEEKEEFVVIRILEDLPPFSGPEHDYKLSKEDIVRMPKIMGEVLVSREKAMIINPSA